MPSVNRKYQLGGLTWAGRTAQIGWSADPYLLLLEKWGRSGSDPNAVTPVSPKEGTREGN